MGTSCTGADLGTTTLRIPERAVNAYALYDLGAASTADARGGSPGLVAHQMGGFGRGAIRVALDIPGSYLLGSVIALTTRENRKTQPAGL